MNLLPPSQDQLTLIIRAAPCPPNTQVRFLKLQRKSFLSQSQGSPSFLPISFRRNYDPVASVSVRELKPERGEWLPATRRWSVR